MATEGVDYSFGRPSVAELKLLGKTFVVRYVDYEGTSKGLTSSELAELRANDMSVAMVYQKSTTTQALAGRVAGAADAEYAAGQLAALGFPPETAIYFPVDFDAQPADQPKIDEYLRGAAEAIGVERVGVYGSFYVLDRCLKNGTVRWAWQTYAWSDGKLHPEAHLYQYLNNVTLAGAAVDLNEGRAENFGQWKQAGFIPALVPIWEQMWNVIHAQFPLARLTSGYRPGDPGYHGRGSGKASDFAAEFPDPDGSPMSIEMTQWIKVNYPNSTELIHTPAGPNYQLKHGQVTTYSAATQADHMDHVHWAYDADWLPGYNTPITEVEFDMAVTAIAADDPKGGPLESGVHVIFGGGFVVPLADAAAAELLAAQKEGRVARLSKTAVDNILDHAAAALGVDRSKV